MKLIEFAKTVSNLINSNELSAAIGSSEPWNVDISKEEAEKITNQLSGLMTRERAINDPEVYKALKPKIGIDNETELRNSQKKSIYSNVEVKLEGLGEKLGIDLKGMKVDDQIQALAKVQVGSSKDNDYSVEIEKLHNQLKEKDTQLKEKDTAFEEFKSNKDSEFQNFKVDSILTNKINSYTLATPYKDDIVRKGITDAVIGEIKNKASIKLDDDNNIKLFQKENPDLELFGDNNNKSGIDDILNPLMQPYLQVTKPKPDTPASKIPSVSSDNGLPDAMHPASPAGSMIGQGSLM